MKTQLKTPKTPKIARQWRSVLAVRKILLKKGYALRTLQHYEHWYGVFFQALKDPELSARDLTAKHFEGFVQRYEGHAVNTQLSVRSALLAYIRHTPTIRSHKKREEFAEIVNRLQVRPVATHPPETPLYALTSDQVERLVEALGESTHFKPMRLRALVMGYLEGDLRIMEWIGVRMSDLVWAENGQLLGVRVERTGEGCQQIMLSPELARILQDWVKVRAERYEKLRTAIWLFPATRQYTEPLTYATVYQWIRALGKRLGISLHPMVLRQYFLSQKTSAVTHRSGRLPF